MPTKLAVFDFVPWPEKHPMKSLATVMVLSIASGFTTTALLCPSVAGVLTGYASTMKILCYWMVSGYGGSSAFSLSARSVALELIAWSER